MTEHSKSGFWSVAALTFCRWLDSDYRREDLPDPSQLPAKVNWQRTLPFIFLHLGCFAVLWVGISLLTRGLLAIAAGFALRSAGQQLAAS